MLQTNIKNINLNNCISNASGVYCTNESDLNQLMKNPFTGMCISKSCTLESRIGNPLPRYSDGNHFSINSSGLPNNGYLFYDDYANINNYAKPFFVSVSGMNLANNQTIITKIHSNTNIDGIELNLSCPNIIGKPQIGYEFNDMEDTLRKICELLDKNSKQLFGVKLPPYFDISHFNQAAEIINSHPIDFITCINSLGNGLVIDTNSESCVIKPKKGFGGIGGGIIKPIALANVRQFNQLTNCDIIGCGGIETGEDVFQHILCGANSVQIGTQLYKEGLDVFERLTQELKIIMKQKKYTTIKDFKGSLKTL